MNFEDFNGQDKVKLILKNIIKNDKINHSYIFYGEDGVGKLLLAKIFASQIAGEMDITIISPEKDSIKVDQIREIQDKMLIKPLQDMKQVYIIESAEKMTEGAQNCILKTLEEPNKYVVIVLCVSNLNKLLKTIQSRCIKINFLPNDDLEKKEDILADEIIDLLINIETGGIASVIDYQETFEKYKDKITEILDIMSLWYRDFMVYKITSNSNLLINKSKKDYIVERAENTNIKGIVKIFEEITVATENLKMRANYKMVVDNLIISLCNIYKEGR